VPDEITVELWQARIDSAVEAHEFKPDIDVLVLDGIPRNVGQAKIMDRVIDVKKVFHLSCPDRDQLFARLKKRALKDNRLDDANEEVIQRRLETYETESKPVLDYYRDRVQMIDATEPPARVLYNILTTVGQWRACSSLRISPPSSLYCEKCGAAMPVRERLLLILPDRELYDYLCTNCASSVGQREVTAGDKLLARASDSRRARRAIASQILMP
jgi:adenylate kinase family enzyme